MDSASFRSRTTRRACSFRRPCTTSGSSPTGSATVPHHPSAVTRQGQRRCCRKPAPPNRAANPPPDARTARASAPACGRAADRSSAAIPRAPGPGKRSCGARRGCADRATAARIDALQDEPGPGHGSAEALARKTAALTQAVANARGALAEAAELALRRDGAAEAARALAGAAAALKTQGEALDQRIHATDRQSAVGTRRLPRAAPQASTGRPRQFLFRFNRRKTRHARLPLLFALALKAKPMTYNMLIKPEPGAQPCALAPPRGTLGRRAPESTPWWPVGTSGCTPPVPPTWSAAAAREAFTDQLDGRLPPAPTATPHPRIPIKPTWKWKRRSIPDALWWRHFHALPGSLAVPPNRRTRANVGIKRKGHQLLKR